MVTQAITQLTQAGNLKTRKFMTGTFRTENIKTGNIRTENFKTIPESSLSHP